MLVTMTLKASVAASAVAVRLPLASAVSISLIRALERGSGLVLQERAQPRQLAACRGEVEPDGGRPVGQAQVDDVGIGRSGFREQHRRPRHLAGLLAPAARRLPGHLVRGRRLRRGGRRARHSQNQRQDRRNDRGHPLRHRFLPPTALLRPESLPSAAALDGQTSIAGPCSRPRSSHPAKPPSSPAQRSEAAVLFWRALTAFSARVIERGACPASELTGPGQDFPGKS